MRFLRATFQSLSSPNLRLYFGGQVVSIIGTWLQKAAQAWLVLELTGSGTWLGVTAALQQLPTLLVGMWGGLLADRVSKRRILLTTQSVSVVPAVALGVLSATGTITLWMILALALLLGTVEALDKPARHTFIMEMARPEHATNAVTLNSIVQNLGKVGGPAAAGVLIATVGIPLTFFLNAASFVAVIVGLALMRTDQIRRAVPAPRHRGQLTEGLRYVRDSPDLLAPLLLMAVSGTLAYEWQVTLPLFAHQTFGDDARVFGFMFSAMGLGAVLGGLALAGLLRASAGGLVVAGLAFSAILLGVAVSPVLAVALVLLFLLGASSIAFRAVANSHVQLRSDPAMRGRVMALMVIAVTGTSPIGGPLIGWIGDVIGARATFVVGATGTALAALAAYAYMRRRTPTRPAPLDAAPALTTGV